MAANVPLLLQAVSFTILLTAVAVCDIRRRIIPDMLCAGIALTSLLAFEPKNLAGALIAVIPLVIARFFGGIEGGDIKLMKPKIENDVFHEWCDALAACQYDRSLKTTLTPIVSKLSDMKRIISLFLAFVLMISVFLPMNAYAIGDGNVDGGGGGMGDGTNTDFWNTGDEGVRVTVIRANDHG